MIGKFIVGVNQCVRPNKKHWDIWADTSVSSYIKTLYVVVLSLFFTNSLFAKSFATLDWTVAETLVTLGEKPIAVGDKQSYQVWVQQPSLPDTTYDLGVRLQPNLEQLLALKQQGELVFINTSFYAKTTTNLNRFGTVEIVDFYQAGNAWQNILTATRQVAKHIGKPKQAEKLINDFSQKIAEIQPLVQPYQTRPIALVQFADSRHLRIYGKNSPFGEVLNQLGLMNAWQTEVNFWGFENIEITQLAKLPKNSRLVVIKPYPANIETALKHNTLWQKLPLAKDPLILPAIWTFGGVPSAQRFAEILADGLLNGGEQW